MSLTGIDFYLHSLEGGCVSGSMGKNCVRDHEGLITLSYSNATARVFDVRVARGNN